MEKGIKEIWAKRIEYVLKQNEACIKCTKIL